MLVYSGGLRSPPAAATTTRFARLARGTASFSAKLLQRCQLVYEPVHVVSADNSKHLAISSSRTGRYPELYFFPRFAHLWERLFTLLQQQSRQFSHLSWWMVIGVRLPTDHRLLSSAPSWRSI